MSTNFELTEAQKRIWYMEKLYPCTSINTIGGYVRIKGNISFHRLQDALWIFIQKHKSLRIQIKKVNENPVQYISEWKAKNFPVIDFSYYQNPEKLFKDWIEEESTKPFELYDHPLFQFTFFKIGENDCGYLIKLHHIISDMYSISLLTSQIKQLYENVSHNIEESDYLDYLITEKRYNQSKRYSIDQEYWLKTFSSLPNSRAQTIPEIPFAKRLCFALEDKEKIHQFLHLNEISLNVLFNAVVGIYFYSKKRKTHQVIGLPISNRPSAIEKKMMGMFVSTLPFYFEVNPKLSGLAFCRYIKNRLKESYFHHRYPFNILVNELSNKGRDLRSYIEASVNFYHKGHPLSFDGFDVMNEEFAKQYQIYPLHFIIHEWVNNQIQINIEYQTGVYEEEAIEVLASDLKKIISALIHQPELEIGLINLEIPRRFESLPFRNPTPISPGNKTIIDLFEEQVQINPSRIAVQEKDKQLTFLELNNKIDRFAFFLEKNTTGEGIAILGKPSIECIIAILAIQKMGRFYVPIDPQDKDGKKLTQILKDANITTLLIWSDADVPIEKINYQIINVCSFLGTIPLKTPSLISKAKPDKLAYVIYTSGSTGIPKGVKITHSNLIAYLQWAKTYVQHDQSVFAFYSSIAFDLTITSIFLPLMTGKKIKIFRSEAEYILIPILKDPEVTVLKATPSHLYLIEDEHLIVASLKSLIIGGEDLKSDLARHLQLKFGGQMAIYNEYGPTEATVGCMIYKFNAETDDEESVSIGCAAGNTHLLILDDEKMPVGIGEKGELYIGGDQVAQGYLNQKNLTDEQFMFLEYAKERFYKTGDIVKVNKKGLLFYCGRKDEQVKINGYRIELGEIQNTLLEYPDIKNAYVGTFKLGSNIILGAFFVSNKHLESNTLHPFLSNRLSTYKIPTSIIQVEKIPLTSNGKVDKNTLFRLISNEIKNTSNEENVFPLQANALDIIQNTLRKKIDLSSNFFQIGGDSISAIQISSRLASQGINLQVKDILSAKTISEILSQVNAIKRENQPYVPSRGLQTLTPILKWFLKQNFAKPHFYHQSLLLDLKSTFRLDQIENCLNTLIANHDVFCLNYKNSNTFFYNQDAKAVKIKVHCVDLSNQKKENLLEHIERLAINLKNQTDLHNGLLLTAALIFSENKQHILLCAHHLCVDGVSWQILLEDLNQLLLDCKHHKSLLPPKKVTNSFQQWADAIVLAPSSNVWDEYYSRISSSFAQSSIVSNQELIHLSFKISKDKTDQLLDLSQGSLKIHINEILTTAYFLTLCQLLKKDTLLITIEHHGRVNLNDKIDLRKTVGWFTIMSPLQFNLFSGLDKTLNGVQQVLSFFYKHINDLAAKNEFLEKYPTPYRFNYLGILEASYSEFSIQKIGIGQDSHHLNTAPHVDLNAYILGNEIHLLLSMSSFLPFSKKLFTDTYQSKIDEILSYFETEKITPYLLDTVQLDQDEIEDILKI